MKYILFIVSLLFALSTSQKQTDTKLCVNCKFFAKPKLLLPNRFGKCSLFSKEEQNNDSLVDGFKKDKTISYTYCSIARNDVTMCGKEGKLYEEKETGNDCFALLNIYKLLYHSRNSQL
jgi:hypothetical protein